MNKVTVLLLQSALKFDIPRARARPHTRVLAP
nr:MAG TPA: hypothetical protein [Caudoviricetes sp.]